MQLSLLVFQQEVSTAWRQEPAVVWGLGRAKALGSARRRRGDADPRGVLRIDRQQVAGPWGCGGSPGASGAEWSGRGPFFMKEQR